MVHQKQEDLREAEKWNQIGQPLPLAGLIRKGNRNHWQDHYWSEKGRRQAHAFRDLPRGEQAAFWTAKHPESEGISHRSESMLELDLLPTACLSRHRLAGRDFVCWGKGLLDSVFILLRVLWSLQQPRKFESWERAEIYAALQDYEQQIRGCASDSDRQVWAEIRRKEFGCDESNQLDQPEEVLDWLHKSAGELQEGSRGRLRH